MFDFKTLPAKLSDDPNDHVFQCNGVDVGRCYRRFLTGEREQWSWSIYLGIHVKRNVEGVPLAGYAESLDLAKQQFEQAFNRLFCGGRGGFAGPIAGTCAATIGRYTAVHVA